jgi:hypothetical protein
MDDPQSLNLYAYVLNNPLVSVDADGHQNGGGPCPESDSLARCDMMTDFTFGTGASAVAAVSREDEVNAGQENEPMASHVIPKPKGLGCDIDGVICEQDGKNIRVGDYDGDTYCDNDKCYVWHGDGNGNGGWSQLPGLPKPPDPVLKYAHCRKKAQDQNAKAEEYSEIAGGVGLGDASAACLLTIETGPGFLVCEGSVGALELVYTGVTLTAVHVQQYQDETQCLNN